MPSPQLSVRSARARELAHRIAKRERRSISQVVESALELYVRAEPTPKKETDAEFFERMRRENAIDVDLNALLEDHRKPHEPIDL